ncbi:MAG TPA: gamma-glutamyl-gamma-aminobutyrate hydrolase family protein, partial [Methylococcales bacterium]
PQLFNLLREVVATDTPFLGLCYGMSALTQTLGGVVSKKYSEKVSVIDISLTAQGITDELLADLPAVFASCSGHKEATEKMPQGAVLLASSEQCPVHMYKLGQNVYATQFHPELDLESFVLRLRAYKNSGYFSPDELETLIEEARRHDVSEVQKILVNFANRYVTSLR